MNMNLLFPAKEQIYDRPTEYDYEMGYLLLLPQMTLEDELRLHYILKKQPRILFCLVHTPSLLYYYQSMFNQFKFLLNDQEQQDLIQKWKSMTKAQKTKLILSNQ